MERLQVRVTALADQNTIVLAVSGDLDNDSEQLLADAAYRALDDGCRRLVLECSRVAFCDSRGLNCYLRVRREAGSRGVELVLAAISTPVRHVLELTDALQVFVLADTVDEALRPPDEAAADTPEHGIPTI